MSENQAPWRAWCSCCCLLELSQAAQTSPGPPREAWPTSPKSHTPYPKVQQGSTQTQHLHCQKQLLPDKQRHCDCTKKSKKQNKNKNPKTNKINPYLNASLPTFYSIPCTPQRAQAISMLSFVVAALIKTHCSFPVTFLHIFERMLSATTKYLAWILQWGGAKGLAHVLKTKEILP